jgi:hypothetical protein
LKFGLQLKNTNADLALTVRQHRDAFNSKRGHNFMMQKLTQQQLTTQHVLWQTSKPIHLLSLLAIAKGDLLIHHIMILASALLKGL